MAIQSPAGASTFYIQQQPREALPPPTSVGGPVGWLRKNLFSSIPNTILTIVCLYLLYSIVPSMVRFLFIDAIWTGTDSAACRADGRSVGACWAFVIDRIGYFTYGSYPVDQRWRVNIFFAMLALGIVWLLWLKAPRRDLGALYFFLVFPIVSVVLLLGWDRISLQPVPTSLWGGILVSFLVALAGIVFALPLGIMLALGRRSRLPVLRMACVAFIEIVRGVPLITVLIMANTMLPLFLPAGVTVDQLLRPLVGVALFAAAYMAEVVRGGLQAVEKGQYEGAQSLGLGYWQTMFLVVLPQALRIVIPGIVNTFIGLFKDTSLVYVIGVFDLMKTVESARVDPVWAAPTVATTGYAFAAIFYFIFCFGMSRYSMRIERRLAAAQKR